MMNHGQSVTEGDEKRSFRAFFLPGDNRHSCFRTILQPEKCPQEPESETREEKQEAHQPLAPEVIAEHIIADAHREAERIDREAQAVLAEAHKRAKETAQAAVREALDSTRKDHETRRERFDRAARELLESLQQQWKTAQEALELECARLAVTIAEKVLHDTLQEEPAALVPVVREALPQLADSTRVRVTVSAAHLTALQCAREQFAALLPEGVRLDIVSDEDKAAGECVIYGDHGGLDVGVDTQLEVLQERIDRALEQK